MPSLDTGGVGEKQFKCKAQKRWAERLAAVENELSEWNSTLGPSGKPVNYLDHVLIDLSGMCGLGVCGVCDLRREYSNAVQLLDGIKAQRTTQFALVANHQFDPLVVENQTPLRSQDDMKLVELINGLDAGLAELLKAKLRMTETSNEEEKRMRLEENRMRLEEDRMRFEERAKAEVEKKATAFVSLCRNILDRIDIIHTRLNALCMFGNGTASSDKASSSLNQSSSQYSSSSNNPTEAPYEHGGGSIINSYADFEDTPPSLLQQTIDDDFLEELFYFQSFVQNGFKHERDVDRKSSESMFHALLRWDKDVLYKSFDVPPQNATESKVSHTILLYAIMFRISWIVKREVQVSHEQYTTELGEATQKRSIDFVMGRVTRRLQEVLHYIHVVPIEGKALHTSNAAAFDKLQRQAVLQVIGHLAAGLLSAFDFGGVGFNCKVQGAVLTLIHVEILELELVHVGTRNANLLFRRSGPFPLFDEITTRHLLAKPKFAYETFFHTRTPVQGFQVLVMLMSAPEPDSLFPVQNCFYQERVNSRPLKLGKFLGSGTFSDVFALAVDNTFL